MTWNDHDHRGEYAEDRHDHDHQYAEKYHRHYDDESAVRGLREDLSHAEERIRALEDDLRGALAFVRVLDRLRPTCVICHDATADRQTVNGPACSDCVGEPLDDGPDPDRPETWAFAEAEAGRRQAGQPEDAPPCGAAADSPDLGRALSCRLRDGHVGPHRTDRLMWITDAAGRVHTMAAGECGVSEYGYVLPEDYQRGQS